jgi:hypothetical protein
LKDRLGKHKKEQHRDKRKQNAGGDARSKNVLLDEPTYWPAVLQATQKNKKRLFLIVQHLFLMSAFEIGFYTHGSRRFLLAFESAIATNTTPPKK